MQSAGRPKGSERASGEAEGDVEDEDDDMTPPIGCFSMLFADRSFDDERSRMLMSSTLAKFIYNVQYNNLFRLAAT